MDRNAFKRRMQALKSYRESNPGKGYWDWKVQSFEDGGEVSREQQAIQNALNAKGTPNQFMDTWNQARLATGNFNDQLGDGKLELQKANRDATAIYKSPITYGFNSYLRGTPVMKSATMTEQEAIQRHIQDAKRFGIGTKVRMQNPDQKGLIGTQTIAGEYSPKGKAIYASTENVLTHEQAHASNAYPQENRIQEILGGQNKATTDYLDRPTEVYSRLMNFRQTNQIDPNKVWDKDSLKELRKTAIDDDLLNRYKDEQIIDIFNTVADIGTERNYDQPQYLAEGGEVGDPDDEFIQAVNTKLGRTPDGRPKEQGLKPVIDLEDVANVTPIGNALSAKDAYNAARNNDWLGVGLASLGMLPMIPRGIKNMSRYIPTVNRSWQKQIDEMDRIYENKKKTVAQYDSELSKSMESLIENEDAFRRAVNADRNTGSNYVSTYSKQLDAYNRNTDDIPKVAISPTSPGQRAYVEKSNPDYIHISQDYPYQGKDLESGLIRHELGHTIDIKAGEDYIKKLADPKKFIQEEQLKKMYPKSYKGIQEYLLNGSEIKSHMNEFRHYLMEKGDWSEKENVKSFQKKLFDSNFDNLKKLFNTYKSKKQFIKDYNNVPIVAKGNDKEYA